MLKSLLVSVLLTSVATTAVLSAEEDSESKKISPDSKSLPGDNTATILGTPDKDVQEASKAIFGIDPRNKFSLYQPSYFVFGKENLKMQFSGKYRVAKNYNLYLAYTQTMFWNIYDQSAPFDDITYSPEAFYRLVEGDDKFIRSIDIGMQHRSNGEDGDKSRSMNLLFLKTNFATKIKRNNILGEFKLQNIYSKATANKDIVDHMGFWELKLIITHVLVHNTQRLDVEYRFFAGKSVIDIGKGGRELGLVYRLGSDNFNPAFYLQYYSGYAETLLHYNQKISQARLGLLLFF
ncbi:phospholipase A [Bacteriovorax sp. PP10]|uniref:Phosphatidylcholine 1-acylhydrolase n=1 Tax=Bacteriovorax antarcticus TaxID=3088717 RepID=A0ABU5VRQ0_9BACT|nr:phospholipase A [Bacteriovorax sp. PP10]MEA9355719.1 phospholipase A [Bacteriovorax sp. PP10]